MRRRDCLVMAAAFVLATGAGLGGPACGGSPSGPQPVPSLSTDPAAGVYFQHVREAWADPAHNSPRLLLAQLQTFLARWPTDGLAPLAHVYLALVAMDLGDLATSDREIKLGVSLPPGNARDLWMVARARRLRLGGDGEGALALLRPLVGKDPDPVTRSVFEEELALAALATHREYEAITYMDTWLRTANVDEERAVRAKVAALVAQLPKEVLVGSLQAMRAQRATYGYSADIERILLHRLVDIAAGTGDAQLARLLLDSDAGTLPLRGEAGATLGELAASRRGVTVVEGRTLGLLLPTDLPSLRDESADVLRGVMWALGRPRGVRGVPGQGPGAADAGTGARRAPCAPFEAAPPLEEPRDDEAIRLATRNDAGSADRTEGALEELAGEGATVIVAGLDAQTASRALAWAKVRGVAVVALVPPADATTLSEHAFVLGQSRASVLDALARALPPAAAGAVAPVVDASAVDDFPPSGGVVGALTFQPPVSCDILATRAGEPRFPLPRWQQDHARAWLLGGSPSCTRDLLGELVKVHAAGVVALTLEAAAVPTNLPGLRMISTSAGVIPWEDASAPHDEELRRFEDRLGHVGWWTALGRDAATLARAALLGLPTGEASDPRAIASLRALARDRLAAARAPLWSTEATGFVAGAAGAGAGSGIARTVCAVEAPAR